jgi:hypothetical protein
MPAFPCPALERCLQLHLDSGDAATISRQLPLVGNLDTLLALYDRAIPLLEAALWQSALKPAVVGDFHALFVEMERHIAEAGVDDRHRFWVVVPVADRPQKLRACLLSLVGMLQAFQYGRGKAALSGRLGVVIADDSRAAEHIAENQAIAAEIQQLGLAVTYFGLQQQQALLADLSEDDRQALAIVIGDFPPDVFYHKGASVMRNITSLMLQRLAQQDQRLLFMFVDSDQKFHACTDPGRDVFTTNYFYHIDRIFRRGGVEVLTGKVVGDPPVSPAVMAATLLDDALAFLGELATLEPAAACSFHQQGADTGDAAYHDMAGLFGFAHSVETFRFQCGLSGAHSHADCLADFADRLNRFFDGEHPTRMTPYKYTDVEASVAAARTVYTGNYVLSPLALQHFIPFAGLGLRMAGPVLGRLVQAAIGEAFVAANLPMLHTRTVQETGDAEFRPGVDHSAERVDLTGEFERQFFGDVMLFTVIELVKSDYPAVMPDADTVQDCVCTTQTRLRAEYAANQSRVLDRLAALETLLAASGAWWSVDEACTRTRVLLERFVASMHTNFDKDARAFRLIDDEVHCRQRQQEIVDALLAYETDRECWQRVLC